MYFDLLHPEKKKLKKYGLDNLFCFKKNKKYGDSFLIQEELTKDGFNFQN